MEPRAQRHAIREHLNQARAALDRGDRATARAAVEAALALDPHYLAAQALRERIEREAVTPSAELPTANEWQYPPVAPRPVQTDTAKTSAPVAGDSNPRPGVSAEGWARFEYRARIRRIENRAVAARAAIAAKRFAQARLALEEIREIDDAHPELISLGMELDAAEHEPGEHRRPWGVGLVAVVALGVLLLGAQYLSRPVSRTIAPSLPSAAIPSSPAPVASESPAPDVAPADVAPSIEPAPAPADTDVPRPMPAPVASATPDLPRTGAVPPPSPVRTSGSVPAVTTPVGNPTPMSEPVRSDSSPELPTVTPAPAPLAAPPDPTPAVNPVVLPGQVRTPPDEALLSRPGDADRIAARPPVAAASIALPRDEDLVRQALQQYRTAYENLDARSAQAVWPQVDEGALQRAFNELQSQHLTFESCQVQVRGATGSAVCRGSARYVPKVGSREPRTEPRVWTFNLTKNGDTWQIDRARTER